jgi:hypothetical protein
MTTIIGAPQELGGKFLKIGCGESFDAHFRGQGFHTLP